MRFIGRREGVATELVERMDWAEETTAGNERITLFVAFNYGGRAEIVDAARALRGRLRGGVPPPPLRARDARPRPPDPHQRRAADLQLPALAVRLLGARLPRRALAGLRPRGASRQSLARVRGAPAALRGEGLMAGPRSDDETVRGRARRPPTTADRRAAAPGAAPAPTAPARRLPGARPRKRILVAIPWIVFAIAITVAGGLVFALAMIGIGVLCLREYFAMTERDAADPAAPPTSPSPALIVAAHFGTAFNVLLVARRLLPAALRLRRRPPPPRRDHDLDGGHPARHRLDRHPAGPRRAAARPARPRRGAAGRRPRRHLRHRHRRLRDRPHVRLAQDRPAASRRTRRSRA